MRRVTALAMSSCLPGHVPLAPQRIDSLAVGAIDEAWATKVAGELDGIPVWVLDRESLLRHKRATVGGEGEFAGPAGAA